MLPPSLQQGYFTLNLAGFDYALLRRDTGDPPVDDDEVQFIEEKQKSVEILEMDAKEYEELKAIATLSAQCPQASTSAQAQVQASKV